MEAAFEDMEAEDKGEFPEMKAAVQKRKLRNAGLESQRKRMLGLAGPRPKKRARRGPAPPAPPPALPVAAPEVPPPPAGPARGGHGQRGAQVLPHQLEWVDVPCEICNGRAGQIKYRQSPGGTGPPCWEMRLWNVRRARLGKQGPLGSAFSGAQKLANRTQGPAYGRRM